ncbi:MAG: hypothetical protein ACU84J_15795 [Gammaproteobacteria bacterium]
MWTLWVTPPEKVISQLSKETGSDPTQLYATMNDMDFLTAILFVKVAKDNGIDIGVSFEQVRRYFADDEQAGSSFPF